MKRLFTLLSLVLLTSAAAFAQRTIRGIVLSADQEPLIGANVVVKGTTVGTTTDLDGAFSLELPGTSNVLVVSYTGYETQEVSITASNQYTVVLAESALGLEEVVVVGYGTQQKRNITGTVASIKGEDIASLSVQSFDQALQGRGVLGPGQLQQPMGERGARGGSTSGLRQRCVEGSACGRSGEPTPRSSA